VLYPFELRKQPVDFYRNILVVQPRIIFSTRLTDTS